MKWVGQFIENTNWTVKVDWFEDRLSNLINRPQAPMVSEVNTNGQRTHMGHHYEVMTLVYVLAKKIKKISYTYLYNHG